MCESEHDQTLKEALTAAMERDFQELPEADTTPSRRQRWRLHRLLFHPARSAAHSAVFPEQAEETASVSAALHRHRRPILRAVLMAGIAAVLVGSAVAYTLTGAQFLSRLFQRDNAGRPYMDTDQLSQMGGGNIGSITDTEQFRFELVDAVSSGNSAMLAVRVTAKQLASVENADGIRGAFEEIDGTLMDSSSFTAGWHCEYADEDPSLGPNEFFLIFSLTGDSDIPAGDYTLVLHDFVYDNGGEITMGDAGEWTLNINLGDGSGHSRTLELGQSFSQDGCEYLLQRVRVTPLSMTLDFTSDSENENCPDLLFDHFAEDSSVCLRDGTVIPRSDYCVGGSAGSSDGGHEMTVDLEFSVPVSAEAIASITFGTQTVDLTGVDAAGLPAGRK